MAYTFLLASPDVQLKAIALIRDEIDDVSGSAAENGGVMGVDYFLSDERIVSRLANIEAPAGSSDNEKQLLTAAGILDTLATNQAFILKKKKTLGDEVDGPAVAKSIREHAESLRRRAARARADREALEAVAAGTSTPARSGSVRVTTSF